MALKISKKIICTALCVCLVGTGAVFPISMKNPVYAEAQTTKQSKSIPTALLSNSTITVPVKKIAGKKFNLTLTGDRQNEQGSVNGETRYIPYSYVIKHSTGNIKSPKPLKPTDNGQYTYSISFTDPGTKKITVTWLKQTFQDGSFVTTGQHKTSKKISIKGILKFNANKGSVTTKYKYLTANKKAGTLPKPTRKGYTFKGWYTKKSGGIRVTSKTKVKFVKSKRTLYAKWSPIKGSYKINIHPNGGKVSYKSMTVVKGRSYGNLKKLPTPSRTNYNFKGWYTKLSGGAKVKDTTKVKKSKRHTLYARWQNKYTVTFNATGGQLSDSKKTKTVTLGKTYGTLPQPTKTGYVFAGWYTDETGGFQITKNSKVSLTANQTLYARWGVGGGIISSYDDVAKAIIAKIGKQAPSQCAAYCLLYCTAITEKRQEIPSNYLSGNDAVWSKAKMKKTTVSGSTQVAKHTTAMSVVKTQIDSGLPCIVRTNYNGGSQHWLVVVGYIPGATAYSDLYVLDPNASDVTEIFLFKNTKYYFPTDRVEITTY